MIPTKGESYESELYIKYNAKLWYHNENGIEIGQSHLQS
jgi:hypothetical protein